MDVVRYCQLPPYVFSYSYRTMITHSVDPSVRKNKAAWTLSDTAINRACRLLLQPWWSTVLVRERQTRRRGGSNAILMLPRHQNKPHHRRWRSPRISCAALRAQARPQRHKSGNSVLLLIWFPCNYKHSWSASGHSAAKQTPVEAVVVFGNVCIFAFLCHKMANFHQWS